MTNDLASWALIGVAAGLAGMMFPFWRGIAGITGNIMAAIAGAVAFGSVTLWATVGSVHRPQAWSMLAAAAGALSAVVAVHAAYSHRGRLRLAAPSRPR